MALLKSKTLRFIPSVDANVVEHRIRIIADGTPFSYDEGYDSVPVQGTALVNGKIELDIGELATKPDAEGTYDVYVTAVENSGNESDPLIIENAAFDFSPPAAPTAGEIV